MLHLPCLLVLLVVTVEGDVEVTRSRRNHLRNPVRIAIAPAQNTSHVPDNGLRGEGAECNNLRHRTLAVLFTDVLDYLAAASLAKVDVDIGRADALGVK